MSTQGAGEETALTLPVASPSPGGVESDSSTNGGDAEEEINEENEEESKEENKEEVDEEEIGDHPLFPHPLDRESFIQPRITWRELYIRAFSAGVRDKKDWTTKMDDPEIWKKWILEAKQQLKNGEGYDANWSKECIDYAKKELESYREYFQSLDKIDGEGAVVPVIDCVWKSDGLIEEPIRKKLLEQVSLLEDVPDDKKDWHPGSNNQVLDLVHPSLYPLVYSVTRDIDGKRIPAPSQAPGFQVLKHAHIPRHSSLWDSSYTSEVDEPGLSDAFQWLPSVFSISDDGDNVKISSYINNLDTKQQQKEFYPILEQIFAKFVPLFNFVLRDLAGRKYELRRVDEQTVSTSDDDEVRLNPEKYEAFEKAIWEGGKLLSLTGQNDWDKEGGVDDEDDYYEEDDAVSVWNLGELNGEMWDPTVLDDALEKEVRINGKNVKVIVKLANIVLTPENPEYQGGNWHVEAMLNERIVSTGIYYYDQENISESKLSFRQVSEPWDDDDFMRGAAGSSVFRMHWEGPSDQEIGHISTREGRCICFPNIFQHKVSPFRLADDTKPGYRKILVFFLCDPTSPDVYSTKDIAPQRQSSVAVRDALLRNSKVLGSLPEDVFRMIIKQVPPAMTLEEAQRYREKLMQERKTYNATDRKVIGVSYYLCEH